MNKRALPQIFDLVDLAPEMMSVFGGKSCGLARLISHGARVPNGFAVSAVKIPVEQWPVEVRERFIHKARDLLYNGPMVIRSSALGEDSSEKSFAGMFESVLNITAERDLLSAANHCIDSGNSERVKKYAGSKSSIPVGLVVQGQIAANAAGVCFTCNPTGKDHAVVIEAVAGMGDKMVSGKTDPERFSVYRSGTGEWEIPIEKEVDFISPDEIKFIAAMAKDLEKKFGHPLDMEWAMDVNREMLNQLGYNILEAQTGDEAVHLAQSTKEKIDLALLDIKLPDMAGEEVYQHITKLHPELKVIVCSGYSIDGPAQELLNLGAQAFIQKPFSLDYLSTKIKEVLNA